MWHICLHIFRHLAHKFLDIRQYACEIYAQSAEKSDCASAPQSLCGVALTVSHLVIIAIIADFAEQGADLITPAIADAILQCKAEFISVGINNAILHR